jgi:hypothetical protein
MTEQNRRYVNKEIGKLLSEIWRIKGLAEAAVWASPRSSPRHLYFAPSAFLLGPHIR